jgi:hypothetical protein
MVWEKALPLELQQQKTVTTGQVLEQLRFARAPHLQQFHMVNIKDTCSYSLHIV